ncbi:MAG: insulinase family protein [Anaerolineales bacterium]|nr:insulinase family protein [Anaerolineales bacterium]
MAKNQVNRTVLNNGLTVLVKNVHHAPVATFWVFYRVGSRNEIPGITGISHWTEHMMFKGTPTYPSDVLDRVVSRVGGQWNAYTSFDFTGYFQTMPAFEIDLGCLIESDRMVNSTFDPIEVDSERTVIISERQGAENQPMFLLSEEVRAAAYRVHPYHHTVIGDMSDLLTITRDDLYNHYRKFYTPNNAIVVAVGDFDPKVMQDRITEMFGSIETGPDIRPIQRPEPEQRGERRIRLEGDGDTAYLLAAYHVPNATHPDFFPLSVMGSALVGASGNILGGGSTNKSSRLYKALVETDMAASVNGGMSPMVDPTLYSINITLRSIARNKNASVEQELAKLETALDAELEQIITTNPVTEIELEQAIKRAKASFAFGSESVTNLGFWLGFSELTAGSFEWFERYMDNLARVTLDDVVRVADLYLNRRRRTMGWYVPV